VTPCIGALILGMACAGACSPGRVAQPEEAPAVAPVRDEALSRELEELDARGAKVEDLTAEFEQEKFTAILKKPLVSSGRVLVKGGRTRWDTTRPRKSVLVIDEQELKLYDPEAGTLEIYPVAGGLSRMTASPVPRLSAVREQFTIERMDPAELDDRATVTSALALRLTPTDPEVKEHVTGVRVLIDRETGCASVVEVTDADGDRTVIRFKKLQLNTGLEEDKLELQVPPGTTISRPLNAGASDGERPE
jgi:outer membrane lipoprotein-sorting protein